MAEAGITCDYPFIKMGCHQRAICTLTLLAEHFRTQAAYFGVVLMEKRACGSCGREGQRSGQSYGRLLYLTHGAIKSISRPPTRPSSRRHADLQQQACQYFLQQHRQAFTTCCPTSSVIEASCLVLVCQRLHWKSKAPLSALHMRTGTRRCSVAAAAAPLLMLRKDNQRRFSCLGTLLFHRNLT